ncbi:MAG: hypothetical protein J6M60_03985 [Clostridia bacterium]|nr:hypothetical protein [Clostridia bacterium]
MEKQTILIANTHKEQAGWLKDDLIKKNIDIEVLDVETNNSEEMREAIEKYNPSIVLTNELKQDKPASDIIKEIQDDVTRFQPIFIIHSGYPTYDIERVCSQKGIHVYSYFILDKEVDLANEIGNIAKGEETKLTKHLYYSFSEQNINVTVDIMNKNAMQYIYDPYYKEVNNELAQLFSDLDKIPKRFREKFRRYAELQLKNHMLECSYMYQFLNGKMNK